MAYDQSNGTTALRSELVEGMVKGFATQIYKFRQAVTVSPTNAWKNTFWKENPVQLTPAGTRSSTQGIPRGANFPQASVGFQEITGRIQKFGMEDNIFWEDIISNDIAIQDRTIFRVTEAVIKDEDDYIYTTLIGDADINTVNIGATNFWSGTSAAILDDIFNAAQQISQNNYSTENLMCFVSPRDKRSIMKWVTDKGAQFVNLSEDVARNGKFIKLGGVTFVESNSVPASEALVVVPKICATLRELVPLTSNTTEDPLKSVRIRVAEEVVCQVTDPASICRIVGTQQ